MNVLAIDVSKKIESVILENPDSIFCRSSGKIYSTKQKPDLIIVGNTNQKGSNDEEATQWTKLCKTLRQKFRMTPLIFLPKDNQTSKKVEALNAGADDCVSEDSLNLDILQSKVRAIRRGYEQT